MSSSHPSASDVTAPVPPAEPSSAVLCLKLVLVLHDSQQYVFQTTARDGSVFNFTVKQVAQAYPVFLAFVQRVLTEPFLRACCYCKCDRDRTDHPAGGSYEQPLADAADEISLSTALPNGPAPRAAGGSVPVCVEYTLGWLPVRVFNQEQWEFFLEYSLRKNAAYDFVCVIYRLSSRCFRYSVFDRNIIEKHSREIQIQHDYINWVTFIGIYNQDPACENYPFEQVRFTTSAGGRIHDDLTWNKFWDTPITVLI